MNDENDFFPTIKKNIENLIEDEEGNIPGNKLLVLGTMVIILGSILSIDSFAKHSSHSSHTDHVSHVSHSSHTSGSGSSHSDHSSHSSTSTHSSHSSTSTHSNHSSASDHSSHSSTSDHISHVSSAIPDSGSNSSATTGSETNTISNAPAASSIPGIEVPAVTATEDMFVLPEVNTNIEIPNGTPASSIMTSLSVPASSPNAEINADEIHTPSDTDEIE